MGQLAVPAEARTAVEDQMSGSTADREKQDPEDGTAKGEGRR